MKTFNSGERKRAVKKAGFKKGKYSWVNKQSNINEIANDQEFILKDKSVIPFQNSVKYLG